MEENPDVDIIGSAYEFNIMEQNNTFNMHLNRGAQHEVLKLKMIFED